MDAAAAGAAAAGTGSARASAAAARPPAPLARQPSSHGLFGHAARTASGAAPAPRARVLALLAVAMAGYAVALLINGGAARLLPAVSPAPLAARVAEPMLILAALRALAALGLCAAMAAAGDVPAAGAGVGDRAQRVPPANDAALLAAFAAGLTNCAGYAFFLALTSGAAGGGAAGGGSGGVAIWSALVGTYVVLPTVYGLVARGEARTPRKLAGIALCVVAGVLVGLGEAQGTEGGGGGGDVGDGVRALDALFFFACIGLWGLCDGLTAYVGRSLHPYYVCAASGAGFAVAALAAAVVGYCASVSAVVAAAAGGTPPPTQPPGHAITSIWW